MSIIRSLLVFALLAITGFNCSVLANNVSLELPPDIKSVTTKTSITGLVNINSADVDILHKIKGIGKKKAQAIVSYRNKNGLFKDTNDLLKIKCKGINKKWLTKVSKFLTV